MSRWSERAWWVVCVTVGIVLAAGSTGPIGATGVVFRLAGEQFEGTFESDDEVELLQLPFEMEFAGPTSRFTIRIPYVKIDRTGNVTMTTDGPAILGIGGPGRPRYQKSTAGESESGLGDIYLQQETFLMRSGRGRRPAVSLILDLKIPTAEEDDGLGTGERDWGVGLRYAQPLNRYWRILGEADYRYMGNPDGLRFDDRLRLSAGFEIVFNRSSYRVLFENVDPVMEEVSVFDLAGVQTGLQKVDDRQILRFDITVRSQAGGSTRLGVTYGQNDSSEDLGLLLVFSSGAI